jgi:hypothetical protein
MLDFIYDEEAVIQDVDIWQAREIARGNYLMRLSERGVCIHDGVVGISFTGEIYYPEQVGLVGEQVRCSSCKVVFDDTSDWLDAVESL